MKAITAHAPPLGPSLNLPSSGGISNGTTCCPSSGTSSDIATADPGTEHSCKHCGGSGTLRMGDQQYRTCLDCLGQGRLRSGSVNLLTFPSLSAAVGVADAR